MKIAAKRIGKGGAPNYGEVIKEIERALEQEVKPELLKRFNDVVANWEHKPGFKAQTAISGRDIAISVEPTGPNAQIWDYVSQGTKPHTIRPKRAKALRFVWGGPGSYRPKTTGHPFKFGGPGTVSGGETVYSQEVHHPGTKARNFERSISSLYAGRFGIRIQAAIARGILKAHQR